MKNSILLALAALGTSIFVWETARRQTKRREAEKREEIGRWESEGGAAPPIASASQLPVPS